MLVKFYPNKIFYRIDSLDFTYQGCLTKTLFQNFNYWNKRQDKRYPPDAKKKKISLNKRFPRSSFPRPRRSYTLILLATLLNLRKSRWFSERKNETTFATTKFQTIILDLNNICDRNSSAERYHHLTYQHFVSYNRSRQQFYHLRQISHNYVLSWAL